VSYALLATGDVMLQKPILETAGPGLQQVLTALRSHDHVFINLEEALTERGERSDKLVCLRANPQLATEVARTGASVVTLANNHAFDFGPTGLRDTEEALGEAAIPYVGAGPDIDANLRPAVLAADDRRVAFLGLATTLPNGCSAGPFRPGVAGIRVLSRFVIDPVSLDENPGMSPFVETVTMPGDTERAIEAVRQARQAADLVIVGIHWGVPNGWVARTQSELATYQEPLGHALIDAGADAVIGHHPHVLQGVEVYRGQPIFYSLGNFLFHSLLQGNPDLERPYPHYDWTSLRGAINHLGGIAHLSWPSSGSKPDIQLWPIWLDEAGEPSFADAERAQAAIERVAGLSTQFGTVVKVLDGPYGPAATIVD
jgi:poly-gamma-glutamate synthesis protein (capsule biosynthesis protein)